MNKRFDALAQRIDSMMEFNTQLFASISQIFSVGSSSSFQFLIPPVILAYPPTDSPDEKCDDDDRSLSQGSP